MKGKAKAAEFVGEGYRVHVTGRDVQVTEAMKNYAIEKLSKMERFNTRIIDVTVTMDIQKLDHRVDIVMKVDHVKVRSEAVSTDMYASIDKAVDKLQSQLRKYKDRIQEHAAKGLKVIDLNVNVIKDPAEQELLDINIEIEEENRKDLMNNYANHQIVSKETRPLKTLSLHEAMMKMDLSGDAFLIFRGEEDRQLKVIYRRKDRDFGVIELNA